MPPQLNDNEGFDLYAWLCTVPGIPAWWPASTENAGGHTHGHDRTCDISSLTIARIGAVYGEEAVAPYEALYATTASECLEPLGLLADALAAISRAKGPKGEFDALPTVKDAIEGLSAWALGVERKRLRVVA